MLLKKLGDLGMLSFLATKVWNRDGDPTRIYIFEYDSPEAVNACLRMWNEIEKLVFAGVLDEGHRPSRGELPELETHWTPNGSHPLEPGKFFGKVTVS